MQDTQKQIDELKRRVETLENKIPKYEVMELIKDQIIEITGPAQAAVVTSVPAGGGNVSAPKQPDGVLIVVWKGKRFQVPYFNN